MGYWYFRYGLLLLHVPSWRYASRKAKAKARTSWLCSPTHGCRIKEVVRPRVLKAFLTRANQRTLPRGRVRRVRRSKRFGCPHIIYFLLSSSSSVLGLFHLK